MSKNISLFQRYIGISTLTKITFAIVLGIIAGITVLAMGINTEAMVRVINPFGNILVRLLKMIVVPVISLSLIIGVASIEPSKLGSIGVKVLGIYSLTNAAAVALGLFFANTFKPGLGFDLSNMGMETINIKSTSLHIGEILMNIIPDNVLKSFVQGDTLAIIFFAMIFGLALAYLKDKKVKGAEMLLEVLEGASAAIFRIIAGIMQYAPIGVFALIFTVFATYGQNALGPLFYLIMVCYIAYFVQITLVYGTLLSVAKLNPIAFIKKASQATITAFVTRTSSGTLPVTMKSMNDLGVNPTISAFSLPLGATINMNGTAIYLGICSIFVGYVINTPLTIDQQFIVILTATLGAIGAAGIPGGGAIMLLLVFDTIGLNIAEGSPVALAYAMILGIDAVLDMGQTALNVTGDMVSTAIVAKSEHELDETHWT